MKRLALSSFLIGGGRGDGDGELLLHLTGALLLDYYAAEGIGAVLPRRLCTKVTGLEVHKEFGSAKYHLSSLAASTTTETGGCYRLARALLLNYDAAEGTGAVIPCRL